MRNHLNFFLLFILTSIFLISACEKDDDMTPEVMEEEYAMLIVNDQTLSQNSVWISSVDIPMNGWAVIHRDNGSGSPSVPDIISEPILLQAGMNTDISVPILSTESLSDGEQLWVMLHEDTGQSGTYEFDGGSIDVPYLMEDGNVAMKAIKITAPSIATVDQAVYDNTIIIPEVNAAADGWLVIHNDDGTGNIVLPDIIGKVQVSAGINTNLSITLDSTVQYSIGQKLFPMLHLDNGIIGTYEFDGNSAFDGPEVFSNDAFPGNVIFTSFTVTAPVGKLTVSNQVISQNMVWVESTELPADGWLVVHRDNGSGGPIVPNIISEPVYVSAGVSEDILVPILSTESLSDGETIWVMLHEDNGMTGKYEFDGNNGFDGPYFTEDGNIAITPITIQSADIEVEDQSVINNTITIKNVLAARDGWLVIHNDNGSGGIVLPEIIGKVQVSAGMNTDLVVNLDANNTYTVGQKLFPMLHLDNGIIGTYEFDGNSAFDGPEIFSNDAFPGNVIFTHFNVQ